MSQTFTRPIGLDEARHELVARFYQAEAHQAPEKKMEDQEGRERVRRRGRTFVCSFAKIGRNDPCPCGSGRKFKKCHLNYAV